METDNVHPGFTLLRSVDQVINKFLFDALQSMDGSEYLSSFLMVFNYQKDFKDPKIRTKIQGPSVERWCYHQCVAEVGTDTVMSIHCPFWPNSATEWISRRRPCDWPSVDVIRNITEFGCHLVPIGYPGSSKNSMEWRISFFRCRKNPSPFI